MNNNEIDAFDKKDEENKILDKIQEKKKIIIEDDKNINGGLARLNIGLIINQWVSSFYIYSESENFVCIEILFQFII